MSTYSAWSRVDADVDVRDGVANNGDRLALLILSLSLSDQRLINARK